VLRGISLDEFWSWPKIIWNSTKNVEFEIRIRRNLMVDFGLILSNLAWGFSNLVKSGFIGLKTTFLAPKMLFFAQNCCYLKKVGLIGSNLVKFWKIWGRIQWILVKEIKFDQIRNLNLNYESLKIKIRMNSNEFVRAYKVSYKTVVEKKRSRLFFSFDKQFWVMCETWSLDYFATAT